MKRNALTVASLLALCPGTLLGQFPTVSVEAGLSSTKQATEEGYLGARQGWLVGASGSIPVTPWLELQAGIRLHEKGAATPHFEMHLRYMEVPLSVRLAVGRTRWRLLLLGGVAPARELSCAAQDSPGVYGDLLGPPASPGPLQPADCSTYRTDLWDFGLLSGVGAEVQLGRLHPSLMVQYMAGMHNISSGFGGYSTRLMRNRATSIVLSVTLP